ncbi:response regulator transcription factor [Zhongshania aliphaticivorans]|jgi:DNA-binding NarL/FixJ family response regulator|uniref:response regulator transcription factor n=1 Tax=Zhongshania aliphaticivorans TaxID=1470434 RepID=UPI0012E5B909|nr:response regulator transcription factor [Zhongshania aliphaticivorans]MBQ0760619.1 response regulator transcription factor [Zhongshania sp.]CAA0116013.1 Transcriptional regulatory protein DegU [Zhongshania aliphaticivorans]
MIHIIIADDHPLFREAIRNATQQRFPDALIAETASLDETLAYIEQHSDVDLVLLDLNMPGMDGLNGIVNLRSTYPDVPVVILSAEEDKNIVLQSMTYGAVGFITKSMPREKIIAAIEQILDGQAFLPPDIIRRAASNSHSRRQDNTGIPTEIISSLTRRQLLVFERMAKGESNKQIGYELSIAETTVKAHVSAILRKLKVQNRMKAVLCASAIDFDHYLHRSH